MELTVKTFFNDYIIHPFSRNLKLEEHAIAFTLSCLLAPLTLGIAHAVGVYLYHRKVRRCSAYLVPGHHRNFQRVISKTNRVALKILGIQPTEPLKVPVSQDQVSAFVQTEMIDRYYSQKLPPKSKVEVPFRDGKTWDKVRWVRWNSLSRQNRIELTNHYAHAHDKVPNNIFGKIAVDFYLLGEGVFGDFLSTDPRKVHGSDHCCRVALYAAVFAYLYNKYHPDYQVTTQDVILAQLAAAGHDAGRRAEGVDFYEALSAKYTVEALKKKGIKDEKILQEAYDAVANKDSKDLEKKSLLAKCVQNADSADFPRLHLDAPFQSRSKFNNSRKYLDIYNEMCRLANGDTSTVLKSGLTYGDFLEELDSVREEMNMLIFATHRKGARRKFSAPGVNYYDKIQGKINAIQYPLLRQILEDCGVLKAEPAPKMQIVQRDHAIGLYHQIQLDNSDYIPMDTLRSLEESFFYLPLNADSIQILAELSQEMLKRASLVSAFNYAQNFPEQCAAYAKLKPVQRDAVRDALLKIIPVDDGDADKPPLIVLEIEHAALLELTGKSSADALQEQALRVLTCFEKVPSQERDMRVLTSVAVALEKAYQLYLQSGHKAQAKQALKHAAAITMDPQALGLDFEEITHGSDTPVFLSRGTDEIRKRRVRVSSKTIDGEEVVEISLELTSAARKDLNKKLALLAGEPDVRISKAPSLYPSKDFKDGKYYHVKEGKKVGKEVKLVCIGSDKKISFHSGNVEIWVGNSARMWNQYHHVRVRLKKGATVQQCHEALSRIGLPTALLPSRPQDIKKEALAKILVFRQPKLVYTYQKKHGRKDIDAIYAQLEKEQKRQVDNDLQALTLQQVNSGLAEWVNPNLPKEAWKAGARAIGFFLQAGDPKSSTDILAKILKSGLLCAQERYQRGLLGLGGVPTLDNWMGSANQIFTRTLPKSWFDKKLKLDKFTIKGPIVILFGVEAFKRMPLSFNKDRTGVRNPHVQFPFFWPLPDTPQFGFNGHDELIKRPPFPAFIGELEKDVRVTTETMFDISLGAQYIKKLVVLVEKDKYIVMKQLKKHGIHDINGVPVEQAIIVSDRLTPEMVDGFDSDTFPPS